MKYTLSLTVMLMLVIANDVQAFPADPGLGDVIVCRHVHEDGQIEQFAVVQATQSCPPYVEQVSINGQIYTITTTMDGSWSSPPKQDQSNPTCWNEEILLPTD